jgi:DHA2 family multidrug resistance protein-like MFS transporter
MSQSVGGDVLRTVGSIARTRIARCPSGDATTHFPPIDVSPHDVFFTLHTDRRHARSCLMSEIAVDRRAGRREWFGLAVLALACMLYSMDLTVLHLAVPHLTADLQPSSSQLLWIVDIYGFLVAGSLVTMGTLGDRIGRRRLLMIGAASFGAGSVLAAFSTSAEMLIAARAVLGLAGATLAPSTLSLIRTMFEDANQRTVAIGVWITSYSVGGAIGPVVGGALLEVFWWGSVFLLAVPVMAALLLIGPRLLPEFRDPAAGRLDLVSAALSLVAVLAVIYGLKEVAQDGVGPLAALSIAFGAAVASLFAWRQRRLADPLIDLRLFRNPAFSAALVANTMTAFVAFGSFLFTFQYLQLVRGLSPLDAGLWALPSSAGFIVGSTVAPMVVRRVRAAYIVAAGLAIAGAGFAILTQVNGANDLGIVVAGTIVFSLGLAPVFTLTTDLIVGAAPPERAGAASAISETGAELGGALGIAILGSIGTAVYRNEVSGSVPVGVNEADIATAEDTLGGAVAVAERLSDPLSAALLDVARDAFVQGLQLTAVIGAGIMLVTAILAAVLLRGVTPGSHDEPGDRAEIDTFPVDDELEVARAA